MMTLMFGHGSGDCAKQKIFIEWFGEVGSRAAGHGLLARFKFILARDNDAGDRDALPLEIPLNLQAGDACQAHVQNGASGPPNLEAVQKYSSRLKGVHCVPV